jgi:hypothetical protein
MLDWAYQREVARSSATAGNVKLYLSGLMAVGNNDSITTAIRQMVCKEILQVGSIEEFMHLPYKDRVKTYQRELTSLGKIDMLWTQELDPSALDKFAFYLYGDGAEAMLQNEELPKEARAHFWSTNMFAVGSAWLGGLISWPGALENIRKL